MKRLLWFAVAVAAITACVVFVGGAAVAANDDVLVVPKDAHQDDEDSLESGPLDFRDVTYGNAITECPQAGLRDTKPKPLDRRVRDDAEKRSEEGSDIRANQDYACLPQDETSIDVNPLVDRNVVGGANDYRLGWGTSGFYASTDNGEHWYDGIIPFPSLPSGDNLDGGGDPAVAFDREGTVYYADINFNRTDDTSGVWVSRSTNGGFTWSRPCVAIDATPANPNDDAAVCGGAGDPRQPGDGTVNFIQDNDSSLNGSVAANDKEYIAIGPRPTGVAPTCFTPIHRAPTTCAEGTVGPDRIYITWTLFNNIGSQIMLSYSDDRAHSWSNPKVINGGAAFCTGGTVAGQCDDDQFSTPTVNPTTGFLYVAFENFDTPDENQYLGVRSNDGGQTIQGPFFISPVFDVNYPRTNRTDCLARGSGGRAVLTNSCFRVNSSGNVVADKRGGAFADDLYVVISDNRNGSQISTNTDVFFFRSTDGGATWIGPTRVNNDPSRPPTLPNPPAGEGGRDCGRIVGRICPSSAPNFGNDQWYPWIDISSKGDINVGFEDRRLDTNSTTGEWPASRAAPNGRPGNYLVWFFGAQCDVDSTATVSGATPTLPAGARECLGNEASAIPQPAAPINPASGEVIPGQNQTTFPFDNFQISDTASNWDYTFRAGLFGGDYSGIAVEKDQAYALWTDARNGRGSGGPTNLQPGRNPICEQSDVFFDRYSAKSGGKPNGKFDPKDSLFLATPCPTDIKDKSSGDH